MPANTCAILLAAGESTRMLRPKPLLPWGAQTLIEWQIEQLRAAGVERVVAVLGSRAEELAPLVRAAGGEFVHNPAYLEGRASSVRAGASAVEGPDGPIVILGVDQPRPAWLTARLLDEWRLGRPRLVLPHYGGRRGHPVVLNGSLLNELREVAEETLGLRAVIERHRQETRLVEIESPCVIVDLNTLEEYESALASFNRGEWGPPTGPLLQTS